MSIETLWFAIIAFMFIGYAVLDGFDFGVGALYLFVARTDEERRLVMKAIGPVWKGNEVWLVSGGGLLFLAFPKAFSAAFSGFYLALTLVLWCLIMRGLAIGLRSHLENVLWRTFWDAIFGVTGVLLAFVFGVALGNLVRGVPLGPDGYFFAAFWTTFLPDASPGILDWFTVLMGMLSVAMLTVHGANYLLMKTSGTVSDRARRFAGIGGWVVLVLGIAATASLPFIQPVLWESYAAHPFGAALPVIAAGLLVTAWFGRRAQRDGLVFVSWSLFMLIGLASLAWGLFPHLLIATGDPSYSLTVFTSAASSYGLQISLVWFSAGMTMVIAYTGWVYARFWGKVEQLALEEYS
ncbi:MAG: cytochrome d ubiquinol oxidase subunit II [Nitrospira sp.]|nr:cytochrome d ubiquinol oxidase subunit II [Nitrospira sp.]MCP9443240.1 cytochrome d ubiquinol oxidase subunit II [Nitrospira sp.]